MQPFRVIAVRFVFSLILVASLAACSGDDDDKVVITGERVSALKAVRRSVADEPLADFTIDLPEPAAYPDWAQPGGNAAHALGHLSVASTPHVAWTADIGSGSGGAYKLLASPVIADGRIFTMDSRGEVRAFGVEDGDRLWERDTTPPQFDEEAIGGGVTYEQGVVFATTGFGEVLALRATDGEIIWRKSVGKPLRSAPTVADGRVYVIDIENETFAMDARSGLVLWQHKGIAENATLMGSSSPAASGETVVVAYSSGEVFGLRAQNGRVVWSEVLAVPKQIGALPAIADIRGLPVIQGGRVFTISHSGRMVSLVERTGDRAWEADIGGMNTPIIAGNAVYMVSLTGELMAMARDSGRVIWSSQLQRLEDPEDRESRPVSWWGPVLGGGRLWLTNSMGSLVAFSAMNGEKMYEDESLAGSFFLPPVIAGHTLYVLGDDGDLIALR